MIRNEYPGSMLLCLAVLLALGGRVGAAPPGESAFAAGMGEVRELMETRDWTGARARLLGLLEEHEGADYVRYRLSAIREELRRCAVRLAVPQPNPRSLVSGRLVSYNPSTGSIDVRYRPGEMADFVRNGDFLIHPAAFAGNYSIEVRGPLYHASPVVAVGLEEDRSIQVVLGGYRETSAFVESAPAIIVEAIGDRSEVLHEVESPKHARVGSRFAIKVTVSETRVTATFNGRRHLSARKSPKDWWGQVGFTDLPPFDEIILRGKAGTSWIQGLVDASTREAERSFLESYDVDADLPAWLRGFEPDTSERAPRQELLPWRVFGEQIQRAERLTRVLESGRYEEALREIGSMRGDDLPADLRIYFAVSAYVGLQMWHKAVELSTGLVARNPAYVPVRVLHGSLLAQVGSRRDAIAEYQKVLELDPQRVDPYRGLAELYLLTDRLPDARRTVLAARRAGIRDPEVDRIDRTIAKAVRGPNWRRAFEVETEHYRIVSDIDRKTCYEAGKELEAAYARYEAELGALVRAGGKKKSRVFLFSGQAGYESYVEGLFDTSPQSTAGMYSYGLKQLLIWNLASRSAMMETVRHEAVHQYLDELGADPPTWFNEGLAEYLSILEKVPRSRSLRVGGIDGAYARMLIEPGALVPLSSFLYIEGDRFYSNMSLSYAQAWAFVHFLRHGGNGNRELYDRMLELSRQGVGKKDCVDRVFGDIDMTMYSSMFRDYIGTLAEER